MEAAEKAKEEEERIAAGLPAPSPFKQVIDNIVAVADNPTGRNALMGAFVRNFAGSVVMYYLPIFHGKNFPEMKASYAVINAAILAGCGFFASLMSGILSDVFEKKTFWAKSLVLMIFQGISVPLMYLTTIVYGGNFWSSMAVYALYHTAASTYAGPAQTMMQNTAPKKLQASVISAYFFVATFAQTVGPLAMDALVVKTGAINNPALYGPLIAGFTCINLLSIPFWYKAGKSYVAHMTEEKRKAEGGAALA